MRIGIDLGTTYSLVARLDRGGKPQLLPDRHFRETFHTPSLVHLAEGGAYVGKAAATLREQDPSLSILSFFKRHMASGRAVAKKDGADWHAEAVSALVLRKLKMDAELHATERTEGAVVTVPAHFDDRQRRATRAAAHMAGLPLIGLVEEPVAAALHYGVKERARDQTLLVYDLGGGTFDATVLCMTDGAVNVMSKSGLTELGGKEFDEAIGDMLLDQFKAAGTEVELDQRTVLQLRKISENIKCELCTPGCTSFSETVLLGTRAAQVRVRRRDFEARIQHHLDRVEATLLDCIAGAGLERPDIDRVLMVGGSSWVPAIKQRLLALFDAPGQEVDATGDPTKAVALGAALHAAQLSGEADRYGIPPELLGVTGHHLAVRALDPNTGRVHFDTLIRKNIPLKSARASKTYYTTRPNQERLSIELYQFVEPGKEVLLGSLAVNPPANRPANHPVKVSLAYGTDGTVEVEARDEETGETLRQTFGDTSPDGLQHLASQQKLVEDTMLLSLSGL